MTNIHSLFKYSLRSLLVCCYKLSAFSGSFSHSSLQNFSDSIRLDVERWCTFIDVQSGIHKWSWSHSFVILAMCSGSVSCWQINRCLSLSQNHHHHCTVIYVHVAAWVGSIHSPSPKQHPNSWHTLGISEAQPTQAVFSASPLLEVHVRKLFKYANGLSPAGLRGAWERRGSASTLANGFCHFLLAGGEVSPAWVCLTPIQKKQKGWRCFPKIFNPQGAGLASERRLRGAVAHGGSEVPLAERLRFFS